MRFHSIPIDEHAEVPFGDDGRLEALVARLDERRGGARPDRSEGNACYVLSVHRAEDAHAAEAECAEIVALVRARGDAVVGSELHTLSRPDPKTLIRSGIAARVAASARDAGANLLVVDAELSPSQMRNLEDATGLPIADREAVILEVFERNATTRRARLQVEIAHLEYLRPRIRGIGLNMDQQAGGVMKARGPGETASELLARRLDDRLAELRRRLSELARSDGARRKHRADAARVVLVGYTNAGKTSLMNALSRTELSAKDQPFETLDTTSRALTRHGGDVLISDTVGFIRRLPERLFASFESTLAEATEASLLAVVVDVSDPEAYDHLLTTESVLARLGAEKTPRLVVFNKVDRLPEGVDLEGLDMMCEGHPYVAVSARDPASVDTLRTAILSAARAGHRRADVFVPYDRDDVLAAIYARSRVVETAATEEGLRIGLEAAAHVVSDIQARLRERGRHA